MGEAEKVNQILSLVTGLKDQLSKMENSLDTQGEKIEKLEERGDLANEFVRVQLGMTKETTFHRNMLIGESDSRSRSASLEERQRKREKQRLGAYAYTVYLVIYGVLMCLAFLDLLPVYDWEKQPIDFHYGLSVKLTEHMYVPFVLSFLYLCVIFGIQSSMRNSEPFNLRTALALWSLFLGIFSLCGSLRTVPTLLKALHSKGVVYMICGDSRRDWLYTPAGSWTAIFILSKVPELIDTLFIVLRKRKLITLHWYHHITVMTFSWHSWATLCLNGIFFSSLNLTVHAFMYVFYSLTALGYRPTVFAQFITIAQISQMVVGTAITCFVCLRLFVIDKEIDFGNMLSPNFDYSLDFDDGKHCKINPTNAVAGLVMYGSYLWLFCVFYYYAYVIPKKRKKNN